LTKSEEEGEKKEDVRLRLLRFLQRYRITPHPSTNQAPADRFLKREPRTQWNLLYGNALAPLEKMRAKMKLHFDEHEHTKTKDELTVGANVLARVYRNKEKWTPGRIIKKRGKVMWLITVPGYDKPWTRHSNQLRFDKKASDGPPQGLPSPTPSTESVLPDATFGPTDDDVKDDAASPNDSQYTLTPKSPTPMPTARSPPHAPTEALRRTTRDRRPPKRYEP
jgi:hypothetical protein